MAELIIGPALALGFIIGMYELWVVHRDVEKAFAKSIHGTQSVITSIIFTVVSMNAEFVYSAAPVFQSIPLGPLGLQIAAGLIAAIKIHAANITKGLPSGSGIKGGESWFHSILIGALIVAAPYVYPIVEPMLPDWVKF